MIGAFLTGKSIFLRAFEKDDLRHLYNWINDPDVTRYMFMGDRPAVMERLLEAWEAEVKRQTDIVFAIVHKKTKKVIGSTGLYSINSISRHAEFRVIIGETAYRGKGIGTEVTKLIINYAFDKLNLNKVWLGGNADNIGAIKSYEKSGFVKEGVLRQEIYRNGRYYDAVRMSILREEFKK